MKRTAKYVKCVGNFMSNGVGLYEISPPCECGKDYVHVDDYTRGKVKCFHCGETLFEKFEEVRPSDKYNYAMKENTRTIHTYSSDVIRIIEESAQRDFKELEIKTETYEIRMKK